MVYPLIRRAGTLVVVLATCPALFSQAVSGEKPNHPERKIVKKIDPVYPDIARRMHVGGTVKLEVVVGGNGAVKSARALGGNPVLIESATDAVRKWKFETTSAPTTEVLQLIFEAH